MTRRCGVALITAALLIGACGSDAAPEPTAEAPAADAGILEAAGIRLVSADDGAALQAEPPADLVILDVRTSAEFSEGHLEGARLLDFYEPDFAASLAELDPNVAYLLYCRSGNRSGQTAALMRDLGFADVAEIDGGIVAWSGSGHETVAG